MAPSHLACIKRVPRAQSRGGADQISVPPGRRPQHATIFMPPRASATRALRLRLDGGALHVADREQVDHPEPVLLAKLRHDRAVVAAIDEVVTREVYRLGARTLALRRLCARALALCMMRARVASCAAHSP